MAAAGREPGTGPEGVGASLQGLRASASANHAAARVKTSLEGMVSSRDSGGPQGQTSQTGTKT